jgi:AraC-like DNA-binding protein
MITAVRSLIVRPGVGTTANVVQQSTLRLSHMAVERPALIFLHHGTKTLKSGSQQWIAERGDVVAVAGGQTLDILNRLSPEGLYEARWVVWDDDLIQNANDGQPPRTPTATVLKRPGSELVSAIERAVDAIRDRDEIPDAVARHRLQELLVWLAENDVVFGTRQTASMKARLRQLFATAPSAAWTISGTAEHFAMSEATLRRRLSADGTNFATVLSDFRMSSAMTLLQSTERPISHIASDVGYGSASRFSVRFRSRFGFAPSEVRGHRSAHPPP